MGTRSTTKVVRPWLHLILATMGASITACAPASDPTPPDVDYSSVQAVQFGASPQPMTGATAGQGASMGSGGMSAPVAPSGGAGGMGAAGMQTTNPAATGSGGMGAAGMTAMSTGTGGMMGANGTKPPTSTGTGGMGGSVSPMSTGTGGMSGETAGPKPTKLTATITTKTQGGQYAPKNVGAIWIEDSSGKWVYTLDWWNSLLNAGWLSRYGKVKGPSFTFFDPKPGPDVVTSATLPMHKTHNVSWGLEGSSGSEVPDGDYKLVIELTEKEGDGQFQEIPFTKGAEPVTLMPADTQYYTGIKITLE